MKRLRPPSFAAVFFLTCCQSPVWASHSGDCPRAPFPSRTITDTLTPELVFKETGTVSYIHIYEENSPFRLDEAAYSKRRDTVTVLLS
ncbi:hypothetical protein SCACP_36910 [Sporomusa carbonis]